MNLLLDTHAVLWWFAGDERMPVRVRSHIFDAAAVWVSVVSAYEIKFKHRLGKLPLADSLVEDLDEWMGRDGFRPLSLDFDHAIQAAAFAQSHRDPFDRMLIAQAFAEDLAIVSRDTAFDAFGVRRIW